MTITNQKTAPNGIDTQALQDTLDAVRKQPELAQVTFGIDCEWLGGCHQRSTTADVVQNGAPVRTTRFTMESDEPEALLGTDHAPNPGEYVLQALAGCYAATFAAQATVRGIELETLRLEMETDFDLQGFLGIDQRVRPGAQAIRVVVHATASNASGEDLQALVEAVEAHSPIRDTLANPVPVTTTLAR
ncbi:OsmC family protein [Nocardioides sp. JQ2195]|uniref:OsmC family protein n=1 Tax=Nocardioides sp. JQ2195 TaxID=2592334 RepID=UPI00143E0FC5|nr:OsmC family protein [Nocardioides sp. JQ2195]QIX28752.1 OsmC family protein [Nocardioides sp. JQ2195]